MVKIQVRFKNMYFKMRNCRRLSTCPDSDGRGVPTEWKPGRTGGAEREWGTLTPIAAYTATYPGKLLKQVEESYEKVFSGHA